MAVCDSDSGGITTKGYLRRAEPAEHISETWQSGWYLISEDQALPNFVWVPPSSAEGGKFSEMRCHPDKKRGQLQALTIPTKHLEQTKSATAASAAARRTAKRRPCGDGAHGARSPVMGAGGGNIWVPTGTKK